jgi:hypothetical protein
VTTHNGKAGKIVAYVQAHPGCTRAQLLADCGAPDEHWAMPTYCSRVGLIHPAGPRGSLRYYPTAEQAAAEHPRIVAAVKQRRAEKRRAAWIQENARRRAKRHANGSRPTNTRPGRHAVMLDPGARFAPDVRVVIAPPMRGRWA